MFKVEDRVVYTCAEEFGVPFVLNTRGTVTCVEGGLVQVLWDTYKVPRVCYEWRVSLEEGPW